MSKFCCQKEEQKLGRNGQIMIVEYTVGEPTKGSRCENARL